jgi:aspartyl/asparaginyl beta-hydroxylase (cupin superfamily)
MSEPAFWDSYLEEEPISKAIKDNWQTIRDEVLGFKEKYPQFFVDYPKFKIVDEETNERVRMYENDWKVSGFTKFDESYKEIQRVNRRLGDNLNKLIERYLKKFLPTVDALIKPYEAQGLLSNGFVSILSPGTIIKPHTGYSNEYMRIHLGLIPDSDCKITVGSETRTWEEGKLLAFKDGGPYKHSVKHEGTHDRYIFSFDLKLDYLKQYIPEL